MNKDIQCGRRILNEVMGGNPFKQIAHLKVAILGIKANQNVIIKELGLENNETIQKTKEEFNPLLQEVKAIERILRQEYPEDFIDTPVQQTEGEKVLVSDDEVEDKLNNL